MTMILALSDTHLTEPLSNGKYLPNGTIDLIKKAQLVLHAGDIGCQNAYNSLFQICVDCQCDLWAVLGRGSILHYSVDSPTGTPLNNDGRPIKHFGLNIHLAHNATKDYNFSESYALEMARNLDVDLLVFGHIHEPIISWTKDSGGKRRLLVCPGYGTIKGLDHKCPTYPSVAQINVDCGRISSVQITSIKE